MGVDLSFIFLMMFENTATGAYTWCVVDRFARGQTKEAEPFTSIYKNGKEF
jgi:hypothetical protein